jgi:DNA ligase-1
MPVKVGKDEQGRTIYIVGEKWFYSREKAEQRAGSSIAPSAPPAKAPVPKRAPAPAPKRAPVQPKRTGDPIGGGVMLAEKWTPDVDPTGCWMSEKLDGVRAYWNGEGLYSRNGNLFHAPEWFTDLLPPDTELDGELYVGPGKFNDTISIVRSGEPDERWRRIRYMVFDLPGSSAPFEARVAEIHKVVARLCAKNKACPIVPVAQVVCESPHHLGAFHASTTRRGIEGVMLRVPGSRYERRRSRALLKVKDFMDAEARITGYVPGEGKHKGRLGAYEAVLLDGGVPFRVGTGLTDADRERPIPRGTIITVRFQELTPAGVPRFPSFVSARDYE